MCNLKVVVAHIYPRVTGQRQTLNIGLSALFFIAVIISLLSNPHLVRSFQ